MPDQFTREILFYGSDEKFNEPIRLTAGPLKMLYDSGSLRYIKFGDHELVRMIYTAVRDHNWNTAPAEISDEKIEIFESAFNISYRCNYRLGMIDYYAEYTIVGDDNGNISFTMEGESKSDFLRNRIGFCVLHPIRECIEKPCKIIDASGKEITRSFPGLISPNQPFKHIKEMHWPAIGEGSAILRLIGDIFETEDQRNWTDASFKTYCTPLGLSFPVQVKKGEKLSQQVQLCLEITRGKMDYSIEESVPVLIENLNANYPLPIIGIARNTDKPILTGTEINQLKSIQFSHYRVELLMNKFNWPDILVLSISEAELLNWKLELVLFFTDNFEAETEEFIRISLPKANFFYSILLLSLNHKTTPSALIEHALLKMRKAFPFIKIGAGTNAYFAELNRERVNPTGLDFLSFSINPQVHAFDNLSIIETLEAQEYTIESAKAFSRGAKIHVSPITLKPRFNPNSTGVDPEPKAGELPIQVDVRQMSLFNAGFTLGSIAKLAEAGASSITFFETVGWKGIIQGKKRNTTSPKFKSIENMVFPVYHLFYDLLKLKNAEVIGLKNNRPLMVSSMALKNKSEQVLFIANHTNKKILVNLVNFNEFKSIKVLDENNAIDAMFHPEKFIEGFQPIENKRKEQGVKLLPFSLCILKTK